MIDKTSYRIKVVTSNLHRGVVFLVLDDKKVTAKHSFDKLNDNTKRHFRTRFDAWRDGKNNPKWYHGWNSSEFGGKYIRCFVFKCKERRLQQRLYGFLCNPNLFNNRGYLVCVLVTHALKKEHETDTAYLDDVEKIRKLFINSSTLLDLNKSINDFFKGE